MYEYGILSGMEDYEPLGTNGTIELAMADCNDAERDWSGSDVFGWKLAHGRLAAPTADNDGFWYVRRID